MEVFYHKVCLMCKEEKGTDEFRGENKTCNQCRDIENRKYAENTYTCPLCKFEIKTKRKSTHEKSVGHQYYLQQHEKNEEPEKPDVITIHNGVKHFMCFGCRISTDESGWGSHMFGNAGVKHFENKKKYEERKRANPNSDEMKVNRFWLRKSIV